MTSGYEEYLSAKLDKYEDCGFLTPRAAFYIAVTLEIEADEALSALAEQEWEAFDWLPPIALLLHGNDAAWLARFTAEAASLRKRLLDGQAVDGGFVQNMAQQIWVSHVFSLVPGLVDGGFIPAPEAVGLDLAPYASDFEWSHSEEAILPDLDHEYLWDLELDGMALEQHPSEMGIGDELDPDHWFDPFWGGE